MKIKETIKECKLDELFYQARYGIEREGLRVCEDGSLSLTDHPKAFGSRDFHPYIQTDFSESQLELITCPLDSIEDSYHWLEALHDVVQRTLPDDEWMWPMSMPAKLPSSENIPIAKLTSEKDVNYRKILAKKYGKKKQMLSGIHYNFEFAPAFIEKLFNAQNEYTTYRKFQSVLYLKLAKNVQRYRWFLTYLLGASPLADESFFGADNDQQKPPKDCVRSIRSSHHGYVNDDAVDISFDSLEEYVSTLQHAVEKGLLCEEREFYSAVRLRGTKSAVELLNKGISYVELRMFDLDPFAPYGIAKETMQLIHLFCQLMVWMDETVSMEDVKLGEQMNHATALEHPHMRSQFHEEGSCLIEKMMHMVDETNGGQSDKDCMLRIKEQLSDPKKTIAGRMLLEMQKKDSYLAFGLGLARRYKQEAAQRPYALRGFSTMELSTQLLIFDAFQKGIEVEILDEHDQFLLLKHQEHMEYVKNANMTSKDQYIAPLIMANKTVTKKILSKAGFRVPSGEEYLSPEMAHAAYWRYLNKPIVVKPKSTNYGLGISVFKEGPAEADYQEAVAIAFKEDRAVLVEEYIEGTEYRFFVLDGRVPAVLLRVPANVEGDGASTIKTLVAEKNKDELRGTHHRAPLEKIQLGEIEQLALKEQGYTIGDIPEKGKTVYLRQTSNISTGGDSIDFTDQMHESYKRIAVEITHNMGARVSGVDLIIPDYHQPSTAENPGYTAIEANFNPAMHMHAFVHQGQGRRLTLAILKMLFPELAEQFDGTRRDF